MLLLDVPFGGPSCTVHTTDLKFLLFSFCDPDSSFLGIAVVVVGIVVVAVAGIAVVVAVLFETRVIFKKVEICGKNLSGQFKKILSTCKC